jgi:spore germination protein GerM
MNKREKIILYSLLALLGAAVIFFAAYRYRERIFGINRILVYFVSYDESANRPFLLPVGRKVSPFLKVEKRARAAIEELLKGPSPDEEKNGIATAMPQKAILKDLYVEDGILYVDFSKEIEEGGGSLLMTERLAQIVFTATQFETVEKVRLKIEGSYIEYFSGEGITDVDSPMTRENFEEFNR